MNFRDFYQKWQKVMELLQKEKQLSPDQIPKVDQIMDASKADGFESNLETILKPYIRKYPEIKNYMVQAGLLESADVKGWENLNTQWMMYSTQIYQEYANYKLDLAADQWAKGKLTDFDEEKVEDLLKVYADSYPKYAHAIRKLNAAQEYYPDYNKLTKEQKDKINSNQISELTKTYYEEAENPGLQDYISKRIDRLMHMEKAFGEASEKALNEDLSSPYGTMQNERSGTYKLWFPLMQYQHPGMQSTPQGCWSVTLSALLKHKGVDVSQNDLRQFKPEADKDGANKANCGQVLSDYAPLIHKLLPNTMVCKAQLEVSVPVGEKDVKKIRSAKSDAKYQLNDLLQCGLEMAKSPIGLWINGHYRVVYGVEYGHGADDVYIHDPSSKRTSKTTLSKLIEQNLDKQTGKCLFSVDWIQDFQVSDDKKLTDLPTGLAEEIAKNPEDKDFAFVDSRFRFNISVNMPDQVYTKAELTKLREEAAANLKKGKKTEEKLKRWDENTKENLADYEALSSDDNKEPKKEQPGKEPEKEQLQNEIDEFKEQIDKLQASIEKNNQLLVKIENTLKDKPDDDDFTQAKEVINPKKLEVLRSGYPETAKKLNDIQEELNNHQKELNKSLETKTVKYQEMVLEAQRREEARQKKLAEEKNARQEIFDTYLAIKDTKNYGRKSHEPFQRMVNALKLYRAMLREDGLNTFTEVQKQEAAKNVHDTCVAYLEKHIVRDKNGTAKIGGQTYETGAMRKQAAVQILELLENLPEYQKAVENQQNDLKTEEEIAPAKKGQDAKREKINFNQLKGNLKDSLTRHTKTKQVAPGKDAAYADLEAAKAKLRK